MKMGDLERATGVSRSTIRGYLQMGLLRPPRRVGPRTYLFDDDHVRSLARIRTLREQGQSLRSIKQALGPASTGPHAQGNSDPLPDRRAQLRGVATKMFAERGYAAVKLTDIAREANMTKAAFYRYFDSKEALFVECVEQIRMLIVPIDARKREGSDPDLNARGTWRARVALENFETYRMVANFLKMVIFGTDPALARKARRAYDAMVTDVREDMVQATKLGLYRADVDHELHCYMLFGALMGAGLKMATDPRYSLDDALNGYMDLVAHGTVPKTRKKR